jgi:hypothetical protein
MGTSRTAMEAARCIKWLRAVADSNVRSSFVSQAVYELTERRKRKPEERTALQIIIRRFLSQCTPEEIESQADAFENAGDLELSAQVLAVAHPTRGAERFIQSGHLFENVDVMVTSAADAEQRGLSQASSSRAEQPASKTRMIETMLQIVRHTLCLPVLSRPVVSSEFTKEFILLQRQLLAQVHELCPSELQLLEISSIDALRLWAEIQPSSNSNETEAIRVAREEQLENVGTRLGHALKGLDKIKLVTPSITSRSTIVRLRFVQCWQPSNRRAGCRPYNRRLRLRL